VREPESSYDDDLENQREAALKKKRKGNKIMQADKDELPEGRDKTYVKKYKGLGGEI
jgi:hypothetical protein